jgi:hypothetical protein
MIDPITGMAILKGASSVGKYLINSFNKPKSFDETAYGKRLKMLSQTGDYNNKARSNIIGGVARTSGNIAQGAKADYTGRMIAGGMEGSVATQRGMNDIATNQMNIVSDTAKDIETKNELSKQKYANQYAEAKTGYSERIDEYNRNNTAGLISGVVDAATGYATGKLQEAQLAKSQGLAETQANRKWEIDKANAVSENIRAKSYAKSLQRNTESNIQNLSQFQVDGKWDTNKIFEYAKTLTPDKAQAFIDQMTELGIIRDWSNF